ncbi:MAG TPA: cytidine deaminase [Clostridiales bacterium]|nr:cytidine deaminase [Clostridiales bacterium]
MGNLDNKEIEMLIKSAFDAQKNSYAPYSKFNVGASLLCESGKIYEGANIENASYPAGICAERVVYSKAISEGEKEFVAVCITCSNPETYAFPCGVCRQFMSEFSVDTKVIVAKSLEKFEIYTLNELLPHNFNSENL